MCGKGVLNGKLNGLLQPGTDEQMVLLFLGVVMINCVGYDEGGGVLLIVIS